MNTQKQCPQPGQKTVILDEMECKDNDYRSFLVQLSSLPNSQDFFRKFLRNRPAFVIIPIAIILLIGSIALLNASIASPFLNTEALQFAYENDFEKPPLPDGFQDDFIFQTNEKIQPISESLSKKGKEALSLFSTLESYEDHSLTAPVLFGKYKSMMTAATIISATATDLKTQHLWSELAIKYGKKTLALLPSKNDESMVNLDDLNSKLLMSMALNFLQGGTIHRADIIDQYHQISLAYTTTKPFRNNKLFKALERQGIIGLSNYSSKLEL